MKIICTYRRRENGNWLFADEAYLVVSHSFAGREYFLVPIISPHTIHRSRDQSTDILSLLRWLYQLVKHFRDQIGHGRQRGNPFFPFPTELPRESSNTPEDCYRKHFRSPCITDFCSSSSALVKWRRCECFGKLETLHRFILSSHFLACRSSCLFFDVDIEICPCDFSGKRCSRKLPFLR